MIAMLTTVAACGERATASELAQRANAPQDTVGYPDREGAIR
jgi:hypothetical protein